ncbi:MAG: cytochrome d ubiquinol oxidase subunit II [Streptosporangiales bacterium]|nr:cytochrome d ubiquinol oxidase subunit II [Streptosporangiales bacterium]
MELSTVWFAVVAFFWVGYLVLDGFDFGVGALLPVVGRRGEHDRAAMLQTIGPVWDGNEVWLVVAVGATFAAFPAWYATMLSAFYLPMLAILVALIGRGVALEFRGKRDDPRWRRRCDAVVCLGSLLPAALWGAVFGTLVHGLPLDRDGTYAGSVVAVDGLGGVLGAAAVLGLCVLHGATFLALRTTGGLRERALRVARYAAPAVVLVVAGFLGQVQYARGDAGSAGVAGLAVVALLVASVAAWRRADGWAFAGTAVGVAAAVATVFVALFPDAVPATSTAAWSLTLADSVAQPYALRILTVIAVICTPLVLAYQAWSYWVFRRRVLAP